MSTFVCWIEGDFREVEKTGRTATSNVDPLGTLVEVTLVLGKNDAMSLDVITYWVPVDHLFKVREES